MRGSFFKIGVVLGATMLSLLAAELVVRLATIYPNTIASNRVPDPDMGFRASAKVPEVDANGFRNPPGRQREMLAVGDSHTFGFNVRSNESWPARLAQRSGLQVYNLGSGGYGLLTYHAALMLQRRPETKYAIVGLFPTNDFELYYASDADCLILDNPSAFWREQREKLGLDWPAYPVGCLHNDYDTQPGLYERLKAHVALLALVDDVATNVAGYFGREQKQKFPSWTRKSELLTFPDGVFPITLTRIEKHNRSVDLSVPEVAAMWANLPRLLAAWKQMSNEGLQVGVMAIPSRERIVFEYFSRQNRLGELDPRFVEGVQRQISLETKLRQALEESGIAFVFAVEDTYRAFLYGRQKNIPLYPNTNDGHPLALGYLAYANAAKRLVDKMGIR